MKKNTLCALSLSALSAASVVTSPRAHALDQIIRPYQSVRSSGMGGVRLTTGLYDENLFANPARATANPRFRLTILDPMIETNSNLPSTVSDMLGSGDTIQKIASTAGGNNHGRIQTTMPAFYVPAGEGKWAFGFALVTSTQADVSLRRSFQASPQFITDVGPAFNVARRFLENDALSVGLNSHLTYRIASDQSVSFIDLLNKRSLSPTATGGQSTRLDFDLGATYKLPILEDSPFKFSAALVIDSLLDGRLDTIGFAPINSIQLRANRQLRGIGGGLSATRESWWKLTDTTFAFEMTDIGNNPDGSLFRLVHIGAETHWSVLAIRAGINQGYFTAGLGVDLRFFTLDLSTYAEEMSLNPGGFGDRRYAVRIAFGF
jgi:hypothetical protein